MRNMPPSKFSIFGLDCESGSSTYETEFLHFQAFLVFDFGFGMRKSASRLLKLAILHFPHTLHLYYISIFLVI